MEEILKLFPHALSVRNYKGGKEIRVYDLEHSISIATKAIEQKELNIEIFDKDPSLRSFSIRENKGA